MMMDESFFAGDEFDAWDQDTGKPTVGHFSNALQVWAALNFPCSVEQAAKAFKAPATAIIEAVEFAPWMYLEGPDDDYTKLMIEHEGE